MFQLVQNNNDKLEKLGRKQDKLETMFNAQNNKINEIFSELNRQEVGKGKDKKKSKNEFYQVNLYFIIISFIYQSLFQLIIILQDEIRKLSNELFHEHKTITDDEIKLRLKDRLYADEYCKAQLKKLEENGISYDELWTEKLNSAVSIHIFSLCKLIIY